MKEQNGWKQMKDIWMTSLTKPSEKKEWKHPTQKPMELLERIILASSNEWDLILDPFSWSWTTGLASIKHKRKYIWIEKEKEYLDLTIRRYKNR
jgi:site-specific DNA-methyltransferase (adenine-specific)